MRRRRRALRSKVEECGQLAPVGQACGGVAELVEEAVRARLDGREARGRRVLEQTRDEVDGVRVRLGAEHLLPRVRLDLRELELRVVRVHLADLLARRRAQDLDDLHQLVHAALAREQRLPEQQLRQHAARRPHVCTQRTSTQYSYEYSTHMRHCLRHLQLTVHIHIHIVRVHT